MTRRLLASIILFGHSAASADALNDERFSLSLGGFFTDRDTELRLDSTQGSGTTTNLEDDLGLDRRSSVFRLDGYFRFSDRHRADFSVFDLSRSSSKQLDKEIQWGDTLFAIDTTVKTDFDLTIYKAGYTYSFLERDSGYLGATLGAYVADFATRLTEENLGQTEGRSLTAPLPVLGLRGEHEFADRWTFRASGEFFFLEYDDYKGALWDIYAVVDYALFDRFSIGLGLNSVRLNVRSRQSRFDGRFNWRYTGGLLFLKFDF